MDWLGDVIGRGGSALWDGAVALIVPALFFAILAILVKKGEALAAFRRAASEVRINLGLYLFDTLMMLPILSLVTGAVYVAMQSAGLILVPSAFWAALGPYPTLFIVVFAGDFIGYWRHRLEHTNLLWPSHAVHHSDTEMSWSTLLRFHPINRLTTTLIDSTLLLALGFPAWAAVANGLVRHYYGYFIHADLPWTYGPLGKIFVSPAMHRWHHAKEYKYAGTNFATVFSAIDRAFGTFSLPGPCNVPLGLEADMGRGIRGQLTYPFRRWFDAAFKRG
ncbi:MAG TPA: sterol desaturase family protein [Devosia sp.]|jgi:sterol desaturase/sphingolipid hydroxylase (fatty acid hydroxylase superfamily)|uniref:sterol desaturase family protein n=1 Tax=Devosia sp. TaxID=1871048 RepID=UPI002DDD2E39|nr:sterol desaturase family protein [Devosia sp.]HEV2514858.1 sterol desaturase family protein [Devosia sp.]